MPRSRTAPLAAALAALLAVMALSCKRGNIPGAPQGYNFRSSHIVWKLEGAYRGTSEEYRETGGYKNGKLHYTRFAATHRFDQDTMWPDRPPRKVEMRIINVNNEQYNVMSRIKAVYKIRLNLDQFLRIVRTQFWREILMGFIPRTDLTPEQRRLVMTKTFNLNDEDLKNLGAKITPDEIMGVKVKRYELPLKGGRAILWLYGDLVVKEDLLYDRGGKPFHKLMTPTKLELNKKIPEEVFTPPRNFKLVDATKPIPGR